MSDKVFLDTNIFAYAFDREDVAKQAATLEAGCATLYSEDLQHEQKVYSVQIIDPFLGG